MTLGIKWSRLIHNTWMCRRTCRHFKLFYMQAAAWDELGQTQKSLAAIEKALQRPSSEQAPEQVAQLRQLQRRLQSQGLSSKPHQGDALAAGLAAMTAADFWQAIPNLQVAVADRTLDGNQRKQAYQALSECYERSGDIAKAVSLLEDAAAAETPDVNKVVWFYRAASLAYEKAR
jgi:hypothetical protein